ncbi:MAG TPA: alpha/beta hydrolase fold domain-containing protein [Acidobacteriaceae bacterium]
MARHPQPEAEPMVVSPRWLLGAFALTLLLAAFCGYGALCLLFYQGQWQLLFHPSRAIAATPASTGIAFQVIHFDVNDAGRPRLAGWFIPADPGSKYATATVLYLHDGRGSLSDTVPVLTTLHALGINVFVFDYRGFGVSSGAHPTERLATEDSVAAWTWLTDLRHIPPRNLIVFGDGVGATFAAHIALQFAPAGVILEDPNPSARQIFLSDARARILPLWLLQNGKLDPTSDLVAAHVPRLFLNLRNIPGTPNPNGAGTLGSDPTRALYEASSYPKQYVDLHAAPSPALSATLQRFFDDVLH